MRLVHTLATAACLLGVAVSADAEVFAIAVSGDGARIVLHDVAGPCLGAARLAEHVARNGDKTPGCWLVGERTVMVSFLDGERGDIPVAHLKKVSDL